MLSLSRKKDESIYIGSDIKITVVKLAGNRVMLGIEAPKSVRVWRSEIVAAWDASKGKQPCEEIETAYLPRCKECGYTAEDEAIHMDHHLCSGKIPST